MSVLDKFKDIENITIDDFDVDELKDYVIKQIDESQSDTKLDPATNEGIGVDSKGRTIYNKHLYHTELWIYDDDDDFFIYLLNSGKNDSIFYKIKVEKDIGNGEKSYFRTERYGETEWRVINPDGSIYEKHIKSFGGKNEIIRKTNSEGKEVFFKKILNGETELRVVDPDGSIYEKHIKSFGDVVTERKVDSEGREIFNKTIKFGNLNFLEETDYRGDVIKKHKYTKKEELWTEIDKQGKLIFKQKKLTYAGDFEHFDDLILGKVVTLIDNR